MADKTLGEVWARREELETAGATLLGRLLFEFARLDVETGLCLVWIDAGAQMDALTKQVSEWAFSKRLEFLETTVKRTFPEAHPGRIAYDEWIARANAVRQTRNELVHGRWGIDALREKVVNVIGLPTSPDQRSIGYSLKDLEKVLVEMKALQAALSKLRRRWPL